MLTAELSQTPLAMKRLYSLLCITLLLAGCATTQSVSVESRTRTYDVGYDQVFDAVIAALTVDGYAVTDADRENGIINTDARERVGLRIFQGTRTKVTALVRDGESVTTVVLNLATATTTDEGGVDVSIMPAGVARDFYRELFAKIEGQLPQ